MSSFLVSKEGLAMLADGIMDSMYSGKIVDLPVEHDELDEYFKDYSFDEIFGELNYLNAYALKERYDEDIEINTYDKKFEPIDDYTIDAYLKMLDCYLYQCCEGEAVNQPLYKIMDRLSDNISIFVNRKGNHLYEEAQWG